MSAAHIASPHYESAAEIAALVREFEACTLPFSEWTHAAHLTVALWYLLHHDWLEAVNLVRTGIKRYNEANSIKTTRERGYHETLTLFWLRHVYAFLYCNRNEGCSLVALANTLIVCADKNLPFEYYSRERLFSWTARLGWVEPDLKPISELAVIS